MVETALGLFNVIDHANLSSVLPSPHPSSSCTPPYGSKCDFSFTIPSFTFVMPNLLKLGGVLPNNEVDF